MNPVRAVIIDDERYACERLRKLLLSFPQVEVEAIFTSAKKGLDYVQKQKPNLVFLDIELDNGQSAFDVLDELDKGTFLPDIILVTAYSHYSIKAIKHRVFDYLVKPVDIDELRETIDRYLQYIQLKPGRLLKRFSMLSEREKTVLGLVLEGKSSGEIAELMYLSINTIHTHRRNILKKTGTRSLVDLMRFNNPGND